MRALSRPGAPLASIFCALVALVLAVSCASAGEPAARVAFHVDENDPARLNLVLNNVKNISDYCTAKGETVEIAVVAYGPGLHMLRDDTSPVKERVEMMGFEMPNVAFRGCANTADGMARKEGHEPVMIEGVTMVPSGAVHLIELQQDGWSYLRP